MTIEEAPACDRHDAEVRLELRKKHSHVSRPGILVALLGGPEGRHQRWLPGRPRRVNGSRPVRPRDLALSRGANSSGRMPVPTRFDRWMRTKFSAITARTPRSSGPFAAQSRDDPLPYTWPASTMRGTPSFS